ARLGVMLIVTFVTLAASACRNQAPEPSSPPKLPTAAPPGSSRPAGALIAPENPGAELEAVMAAHFKALGHMEQYDYRSAVEEFREIRRRAPEWIPGAINLAIALLNDTGVQAEQAKKAGADPATSNFDEALDLLAWVLEREPSNPYAHYCRG